MENLVTHPLSKTSHDQYGQFAILGLAIFLGFFFLIGAGRLLVFLYPLTALIVGLYLFQYCPKLYIYYVFWLWFLSSLIRRIIDFQAGEFTAGGFYTTPELVTLISLTTFIRESPKELKSIGLPFILCLGTIAYGTLIGLINNPLTDLSIVDTALGFICPIIFGFHLYSNWPEYPELCRSVYNIFIYGILAMSVYGLYQYVIAPEWDRFYLSFTGIQARGTPEPFGIRVWSTTSAAHQLSFPMIAGILFSLCPPITWISYITLVLGSLTLLAGVVRTAWLCLVLTIFLFIVLVRQQYQSKIVGILGFTIALISTVVISVSEFSDRISQRFSTFQSLESDEALNLRTEAFYQLFEDIVFDPIGKGFGFFLESISDISSGDGTFLPMLLWFGLIGTVIYFCSIFLLLGKILTTPIDPSDSFSIAVRVLCISPLPMMFTGQYFPEIPGLVVWTFLSLGLAAHRYYCVRQILYQ
ncbi:MAG: hypothetical protein HC792_00570 [Acaryochloridaceae cyanobacterium CSU_5_19]|nr:hypothetical protein [Acaryochloridaceae cyanobacterium CSU_5_19]